MSNTRIPLTADNRESVSPNGKYLSKRYKLLRIVGSGSSGTVYQATDCRTGTTVAVKILHHGQLVDRYRLRFMREVQLLRSLSHPNILRFIAFGRDKAGLYLVTEFVHGTSLEKAIGMTGIGAASRLLAALCRGLAAIHAAGAVHRDIKPSNIMLTASGQPLILDLGMVWHRGSHLTKPGTILGTPHYIAPEIWRGKPPSPSSDLYALGVVLYELLTEQLPFAADDPATLERLHLEGAPTRPSALRPAIPGWLDEVVLKLLAKRPEQRPPSAESVLSYFP